MDILGDPGLTALLQQIRGLREEVQEANAQPMAIDTCDCPACQVVVDPFPKGRCEWSPKSEQEEQ